MDWVRKHFRQIIYISFLFPIILVAIVSISHVTEWYSIGNPISWAIYLSIAVEVAALSSLAAIVGKLGKRVYFPFILVTFIQFIGNVFFTYQWIDTTSELFLDWVEMVGPLLTFAGIEETDLVGHQRVLAFLGGGLLPLISLTFLGLLVRFEEKTDGIEEEVPEVDAKDLVGEISKVRLSDEELNEIDEKLKKSEPKTKDEIIEKWKDSGLMDDMEYPYTKVPESIPVPIVNPPQMETPDPTPSATPMETPEPTPSATPMETPEPTPSATPMETPEPTPSATPMETPEPTPSATPMETPSVTPSPTPSITPSETPWPTPPPHPIETVEDGQPQTEEEDVKKKV